jgi:hypothetical protein
MAELNRTVITALENLEDAVNMSIYEGVTNASFVGRAQEVEGSGIATHCLASGFMDEQVIAQYEMDPRFFVSEHVGRQWRQALAEHDPVLYVM